HRAVTRLVSAAQLDSSAYSGRHYYRSAGWRSSPSGTSERDAWSGPCDHVAMTWNYLMDMDGVLVHEEHLVPGVDEFLAELNANDIRFLVLTNNSIYTPRDLRARLLRTGLDVPETSIWTSALATAKFLDSQRPGGSAFVIGEAGLTTALHEVGYVLTDRDPDYVVLGETRTYSFTAITRAIRLVEEGAKFIATNP